MTTPQDSPAGKHAAPETTQTSPVVPPARNGSGGWSAWSTPGNATAR